MQNASFHNSKTSRWLCNTNIAITRRFFHSKRSIPIDVHTAHLHWPFELNVDEPAILWGNTHEYIGCDRLAIYLAFTIAPVYFLRLAFYSFVETMPFLFGFRLNLSLFLDHCNSNQMKREQSVSCAVFFCFYFCTVFEVILNKRSKAANRTSHKKVKEKNKNKLMFVHNF